MIEICTDSPVSALAAQKGGASRIELCAALGLGGLSPSAGLLHVVKRLVHIPVFVLIRPRPGDFLYSTAETEQMLFDIAAAKKQGADVIVCGALHANGEIDSTSMKELIKAASPLPFTFHRAFDMASNPLEALEEIIALGCQRILTSGQQRSAPEGSQLIGQLISKANGRIVIMPGGGITPENIARLKANTGAAEFHLSAKKVVKSGMLYRNPHASMGAGVADEFSTTVTDEASVKACVEALAKH